MSLGTPELIILAVIILLLFGSRLPSVMRSLGMSVTEFKKGIRDEDEPAPSDRPSETRRD
jgi:sec-independent protein translocase protein TatA